MEAVFDVRKSKNEVNGVHHTLGHKVAVDKVKFNASKPLTGEKFDRRRFQKICLIGDPCV